MYNEILWYNFPIKIYYNFKDVLTSTRVVQDI